MTFPNCPSRRSNLRLLSAGRRLDESAHLQNEKIQITFHSKEDSFGKEGSDLTTKYWQTFFNSFMTILFGNIFCNTTLTKFK